ncbi:MAG: hypothetical protein WA192_08815 [Candidatus Acidiferrales bacterium]
MTEEKSEYLLKRFEDCSLPLELFHHAVHVQIAFLYLSRAPVLEVLAQFPSALMRYAKAHGRAGLYHETITWAYVLLIRERMLRAGRSQTWAEFRSANKDLLCWSDGVLKKYYRDDTLSSELARKVFLFPDKVLPLPSQTVAP